MKIGIYAGSFNPFHKGHQDIVRRASRLFDKVIIYVSQNASKTGVGCKESIERCTLPDNVKVDFLRNKLYLASYVDSKYPDDIYLIRGIRNGHDADYEIEMHNINTIISNRMETVIFPPSIEYSSMCSSTIRDLIGYEGWEKVVEKYLPRQVFNEVLKKNLEGYANLFYRQWYQIMKYFTGAEHEIHYGFFDVMEKYADKERYYHSLIHLSHCFGAMNKHLSEIERPSPKFTALGLAIFYHDYYVNGDNPERMSADMMRTHLDGKYPDDILDEADGIIMATATHFDRRGESHTTLPQRWMMDIDLVDLASDWENFLDINCLHGEIWMEAKLHFDESFSDSLYMAKRKKLLEVIMDYPKIYQTEEFACYEEKARSNIVRWGLHPVAPAKNEGDL